MKTLKKIFLPLILIIAFLIRFINIWNTPALNPDEAALGYNAYSLIKTGKDEHGISWPLHFKSFGDYKPGGYVYLDIPFVYLLGLNTFAVRLPNLILSMLAIYFLYKLVLLLTKNYSLSNLTAFVLAISPWHIHFSRGAWESSAALSFIIIGTYFFFKAIKEKFTLNFILFTLNFILSLYIYHSARLVAPLLALSLVVLYFKFLLKKLPQIIFPTLIGVLLIIPVLYSFLNNGGTTRIGGVGLMADTGPASRSEELLNQHPNNTIFTRIIHNKRTLYLISWTQKYASHFDFDFLAINGDQVPRSKIPEMGQIYILDIPFLILGIIFLTKSNLFSSKSKIFIFLFLFISPIASSLTFQAPSALRALAMVIPLTIFISCGIYYSYQLVQKIKFKKILLITISLLYLYSVSYYFDSYFFHYAKRYPFAWQYKFDELVPYLESQKENYQNIYITNKYDQPYILFLFFSKYPPTKIQSQIKLTQPDQYGFSTVLGYDNYHFGTINWEEIPTGSLIVASDEEVPETPFKIIYFSNGQAAFKIYQK